MTIPPTTLETPRLLLRPLVMSDAKRVQELADDKQVAETAGNIPHPYTLQMVKDWIGSHAGQRHEGSAVFFAMVNREESEIIGVIYLSCITENSANLGFWVGYPYWNSGYCTEAAKAVIEYGFRTLKLPMIFGRHFPENSSSGKVLAKCGFSYIEDVTVPLNGKDVHLKHYELHSLIN